MGLGTKAEKYPFLHVYKREDPDLTYYHSSKPLGMVRGIPVIAEEYMAYKGIIYEIDITVGDFKTKDGGVLYLPIEKVYQDRDYGYLADVDKFIWIKFYEGPYGWVLGDSEFFMEGDKIGYIYFPGYWAAMRGKVAYHRNVKPD